MSKKSINFVAVMLATISVIGLSSCKDESVIPAQDAERGVIAKVPGGGNYSEYIITPKEAIDMVAKDLKELGGKFAKKQVKDVEPLLFSDFEFELEYFEKLEELGAIKVSDPMVYIVRFVEGGYALMTCDKDFGVEILHVQTGGEITKDDATTLSNNIWANSTVSYFKGQFVLWEKFIFEWGDMWRLRHAPIDPFYRPTSWNEWANDWQVYQHNRTNPSISYFALGHYGYDYLYLAPAVLEFLGYFENPSTFFGISGDWSVIKSWNGIGNAPADDWARKITFYCNIIDFFKIKDFLLNECSGQYPNARNLQLIHDYNVKKSGELSGLINDNKPVIAKFEKDKHGTDMVVIIYEEYLQKDLEYRCVVNANGTCSSSPTGRERYSSTIRYEVAYEGGWCSMATKRHYLGLELYYIAY